MLEACNCNLFSIYVSTENIIIHLDQFSELLSHSVEKTTHKFLPVWTLFNGYKMFTSLLKLMMFSVCSVIIQYSISYSLLKPGYRCLGMAPSAKENKRCVHTWLTCASRPYMYTLTLTLYKQTLQLWFFFKVWINQWDRICLTQCFLILEPNKVPIIHIMSYTYIRKQLSQVFLRGFYTSNISLLYALKW